VATCCLAKELENCGGCDEFPCEKLVAFAYDEQQGDDGERIRNLEAWRKDGFEAWLKARAGRPAG
jgi:hypothetical protein